MVSDHVARGRPRGSAGGAMLRSGRRAFVGLLLLAPVPAACNGEEPEVRVDLSRRGEPGAPPNGDGLRLAIGTMLSPRETLKAYKDLAGYLGKRLGRPVEIVIRRDYATTNALLEHGGADIAFVCSGAYVALEAKHEILAVPVVHGRSTYASYVVVRETDAAKGLADLRGSTFAFVDPLSLTGRIYPVYAALQLGGVGAPFFSETVYSHSHSASIDLVTAGRVRAAAVDSLVYDQMVASQGKRVASLRVLQRSSEFGIPPFVAGPTLAAPVRKSVRGALLGAHLSPEGRNVLASLGFERFAPGDPEAYEQVRTMRATVLALPAERAP